MRSDAGSRGPQAGARHLEAADLERRTIAVLVRAELAPGIALAELEWQHDVQVLERLGPASAPSFVTWPITRVVSSRDLVNAASLAVHSRTCATEPAVEPTSPVTRV
jgi:hypothetical protein